MQCLITLEWLICQLPELLFRMYQHKLLIRFNALNISRDKLGQGQNVFKNILWSLNGIDYFMWLNVHENICLWSCFWNIKSVVVFLVVVAATAAAAVVVVDISIWKKFSSERWDDSKKFWLYVVSVSKSKGSLQTQKVTPLWRRGNLFSWRGRNLFFKKKWAIPGLFLFIFVFSIQLVIYKLTNECSIKFCRWLESNRGPLTALPTEPQPLPGGRNHLMDKTLMSKTKAIVINGI